MKFDESMKNLSGVYKIVCTANDMQYFGETSDFKRRYAEHVGALKRGDHRNPYLQSDYNEHGVDQFEFEIIAIEDDRKIMDLIEASCIADATEAGLCYNIFTGGRYGTVQDPAFGEKVSTKNTGRRYGEDFCRRQSESATKQWENDEYRSIMVESAKTQWKNPEYREIMRNAHLGKPMPDNVRQALHEANTGRKASDETKHKMSLKRRGEDNGRAKLTADQVREIRRRADAGESYKDLSREYHVSESTCHSIIQRKTWKYV